MSIDHATLILAIACAGTSLMIAAFAVWLATPIDRFLLTWMGGTALIVAHTLLYAHYVGTGNPTDLVAALSVMPPALAAIRGAAIQFRDGRLPVVSTIASAAAGIALCLLPMAQGLDGLALIADNAWAGFMLMWTAFVYAEQRRDSPAQIGMIAALYAVCGASFVACCIELVIEGRLKIGAAPVNMVENVSAAIWIVSMTGIGGLSLAIAQARRAHGHRREALTDPLTGLLNRRGMVERHGDGPMAAGAAILLFDLDRFKEINDRHGHAIGDRFLVGFAATMNGELGREATVARIGGEEFAVVLPPSVGARAIDVADDIRRRFADFSVWTGDRRVAATVSAGVAVATPQNRRFEDLMVAADRSLYAAKRRGRNCVVPVPAAA